VRRTSVEGKPLDLLRNRNLDPDRVARWLDSVGIAHWRMFDGLLKMSDRISDTRNYNVWTSLAGSVFSG
jgi:hypothetical protein